tara:strand:+ start:389 stop:820 length:432 start_codon:yes stop_codon:yes gene_type:complete
MTNSLKELHEVSLMRHLYFPNTKKLRDLAFRTLNATEFKTAFEQKYTSNRSLWLVKDEGIYLMNCYKKDTEFLKKDFVVYARGFNPNTLDRELVWDRSYEISRDDFAENIPLNATMIKNIVHGLDLHIYISEKEIRVHTFGGK